MGDRASSGGRRWARRCAMLAAALVLCAGGVYLFVFNPATSGIYPICPFHVLTGLHCPGCGTGRAIHQLLHGNLWAALRLNPLAVLLLPPLAYGCLSIALEMFGRKRLPSVFIPAFWIWMLLAVILLFWVLRNLPYYPLTLLAPHEASSLPIFRPVGTCDNSPAVNCWDGKSTPTLPERFRRYGSPISAYGITQSGALARWRETVYCGGRRRFLERDALFNPKVPA
jgi:hypothetical protein